MRLVGTRLVYQPSCLKSQLKAVSVRSVWIIRFAYSDLKLRALTRRLFMGSLGVVASTKTDVSSSRSAKF
jgi:hypothetical protein